MGAIKEFGSLLKDAFKDWGEDKAERLGAALAYYAIFSIGPILVIVIAIIGLVFGQEAASGQIVERIEGAMGRDGAELIEGMIKSASAPAAGIFATVFGLVGLVLGALGLFRQLKGALNTIWEVEPPQGGGIMGAVKNNLFSFAVVIGAGLILLASLAVNAILASLSGFLQDTLPGGPIIWQILNYAVTLGVLTLMFAMIFKFLPDVKIAWKDVWLGALFTSFLFMVGQIGIGLYLGFANVGSTFGAASSIVVVLVWIYYSAQILFFGAELTQVYARRNGSRIETEFGARRISAKERTGQGLGAKEERTGELKASPWFK